MLFKTPKVLKFRAALSVRRATHSGARHNPWGYPDLALKKPELAQTGWIGTKEMCSYFTTSGGAGYCDLKWSHDGLTGERRPHSLHAVKWQDRNTVRLALAGLGKFDFMEWEPTDVEYFPDTNTLRVHYPPGLRRFQEDCYK